MIILDGYIPERIHLRYIHEGELKMFGVYNKPAEEIEKEWEKQCKLMNLASCMLFDIGIPNETDINYIRRKPSESVHDFFIRLQAEEIKPGTRVKLIHMDDVQAPPEGTCGRVSCIDDIGTIHVSWDNGSSLGLVPGIDEYVVVKEGQ